MVSKKGKPKTDFRGHKKSSLDIDPDYDSKHKVVETRKSYP